MKKSALNSPKTDDQIQQAIKFIDQQITTISYKMQVYDHAYL